MCQHNLPCSIVYAHCQLPGRAFASLYVLLFLEKEAEIGGRDKGPMRGSRNFPRRGDPGPTVRKQSGQSFLFSPQLILQFTEAFKWFYYRENYTFPWIQRRSNIFQRGPTFFPGGGGGGGGGANANFYRNLITCDFPGRGVRIPYPPSGSAVGASIETEVCSIVMQLKWKPWLNRDLVFYQAY